MSTKQIIASIVVLALLASALIMGKNYLDKRKAEKLAELPVRAELSFTPNVGETLPPPQGLPKDMPLEKDLTHSATTNFPDQGAVQSSVEYESAKSVGEKYTEYKNYLDKSGFSVTESETIESRAIFGSKKGENITIVITKRGEKTLVQIAHLSFGVE